MLRVSPAWAGFVAAAVPFVLFALIMNMQRHGWYSWYLLAISGQTAEGTVLTVQPQEHRRCSFEYEVHSVRYEGSDQGCHSQVGARVLVAYLPSDPSFGTTTSPVAHLIESTLLPLTFLILLPGLGVASVVRRERATMSGERGP